MTQQEFEQRTGITSDTVYEEANGVYMAAGDIDKDAFCDDYKEHGDSILLHLFYRRCNYLEAKRRDVDTLCKDMAYFLLEKLEETGDEDLDMYNKAVELIGLDEVVRMKLDNDWALWHDDKEYIKSHL